MSRSWAQLLQGCRIRLVRAGCTRWLDLDQKRISRLSLRFDDAGLEWGFRQNLAERQLINFVYVHVMLCIIIGAYLAMWPSWDQSDRTSQVSMNAAKANIALFSLAGVTAIFAKLQLRWKLLGPAVVEITITVVTVLEIFICMLTEEWWMSKIMGIQDPAALLNRGFSDSWLVLAIDTVVTVGHFVYTVRWCMLWPLSVVGAAFYPLVCMIFGSPEDTTWNNALTLAGLAAFAAHGKRMREIQERRAFSLLLKERTLRAHTEFTLNAISTSSNSQGQALPSSPPSTQPSGRRDNESVSVASMGSGSLFEEVDPSRMPERFRELCRVGSREGWLLEPESMQMAASQILGRGSFGLVIQGRFHGSPVAVKFSLNSAEVGSQRNMSSMVNELRVLRHVRHPNIAVFHGAVIDPSTCDMALVLELVSGCSFEQYIKGRQSMGCAPVRHLYQVMLDVCRALRYLHSHKPPIIHGDLKPANVLIELHGERVRAKLLDFGLSRIMSRSRRPLGGSAAWMAPEVVRGQPHVLPNPAADMFSYGRLVHFVATGSNPLQSLSRRAVLGQLRHLSLPKLQWPGTDSPFVAACRNVAEVCMEVEPTRRPRSVALCARLESWFQDPAIGACFVTAPTVPQNDRDGDMPQQAGEDLTKLQEFCAWADGVRVVRDVLRARSPEEQALVLARATAQRLAARGGERGAAAQPLDSNSEDPLSLPPVGETGKLPAVLEDRVCLAQLPGSPPNAARHHEDSMPSAEPPPASPSHRQFRPTTAEGRMATLISVMQRWQFPEEEVAAQACCEFHFATTAMREVLLPMSQARCNTVSFRRFESQRQCQHCFVMTHLSADPNTVICDVCEQTIGNHSQANSNFSRLPTSAPMSTTPSLGTPVSL